MWFYKFLQTDLLQELKNKWWDTEKQSNVLRNDFLSKYKPVNTYYEDTVKSHEASVYSLTPWKNLLSWIQAVILQVPQESIHYFNEASQNIQNKITETSKPLIESDFENWIDEDVIRFYLDSDNQKNLEILINLFEKNNIPYYFVTAPTGKKLLVFEFDKMWVVEINDNGFTYWDDSNEWVEEAADRSYEFYPEETFHDNFWSGVGNGSYAYHATNDENVSSILKKGLLASSKTRGLKNRDMADAVFAITDEYVDDVSSVLSSYGGSIIQIDLGAMKRDNYMPSTVQETPVSEAETKNALARLIGDDSYEAEHESDYMPDTIAIYGDIPAKYLKLLD